MMSGITPLFKLPSVYLPGVLHAQHNFQVLCVCGRLAFVDTLAENMNGTEDERWVTAGGSWAKLVCALARTVEAKIATPKISSRSSGIVIEVRVNTYTCMKKQDLKCVRA